MLRVTVHEDRTVCSLELAGKLGGPWVGETEAAWPPSSEGVALTTLVEEITGKQTFDGAKQQRLRKKRREGQRSADQESK